MNSSKSLAGIFLSIIILFSISCTQKKEKASDNQPDTIPMALKSLNERLKKNPQNIESYYERANWFIQNARYGEALKDLHAVMKKDSLNPKLYSLLGDVYLNLGKPIQAEEYYSKALHRDPTYNDALVGLARNYLVLKDYDQTFALTAKAITHNALNPKAYYLAAWAFAEKGDTLSAIKNYLKAIEQDQDFFDAYVQLGILYGKKQPQMAEGFFKNALRIKPNHIHTMYLLALLYQNTGQTDKALSAHQSVLAIDPNYSPSMFALGYIYMADILDFQTALTWFDRVIQLDEKNAAAYLNRGYCYEQLGIKNKASSDYHRALNLQPNFQKAVEALQRIGEK
ncbi:MAG TPA: tetratricopeptide repeat protein [Bacteroidales bacterium]|jgi:tetratricopeptide (TPR) repeat protein|nr:tetratricopeptide repeat protein [Bacteroidales bacterium]MDI9573793.1 tetratricopeptide repeat protein [Bacteroidota bacterium]OQC61299.1 MAG: tetratricopeptide repeat protein [Bacteroidetes bacterium ADurb.Bin012]MBP9511096.1 tetratricopeptide repeat protein [Bacteroidales bacterium]MBP9588035.1 tetratricopeptide repeat protein [Bacteroidales bacterium]